MYKYLLIIIAWIRIEKRKKKCDIFEPLKSGQMLVTRQIQTFDTMNFING